MLLKNSKNNNLNKIVKIGVAFLENHSEHYVIYYICITQTMEGGTVIKRNYLLDINNIIEYSLMFILRVSETLKPYNVMFMNTVSSK